MGTEDLVNSLLVSVEILFVCLLLLLFFEEEEEEEEEIRYPFGRRRAYVLIVVWVYVIMSDIQPKAKIKIKIGNE
jgi:hypothetical protein